MRAHVVKSGQHLVVVLPDAFCQDNGLTEGSPIDLDIGKAGLTIHPVRYGVGDLIARLGAQDAPAAPTAPADAPAFAPARVTSAKL
jgi:antitoxin component of MazEF toxin-antitoxin module